MILNEREKTNLKTSDFYYDLPDELIAQTPLEKRDNSRLLVLDRNSGKCYDKHFYEIIDYLKPNDVLVINDSKVIPARLFGYKEDSKIEMEIVLLRRHGLNLWETLARPGRRAKIGTKIIFGNGLLCATVVDTLSGGNKLLKFEFDSSLGDFFAVLDKVGQMPLPPYIKERLADRDRYQTVYAKVEGSAAAPTAGLHFTEELLNKIKQKGIKIAPVMLHVGLGTFRPVKVDNIEEHTMHSEYFSVSKESAEIINGCRKNGGRVISVGTTSCRVLESASDENGYISPISDDTSIFIYPGYRFKATNALITNFHLPESTLLMLISAFADRETILRAYNHAIDEKYRFFSFGDAMFIM